MNWKVFVIQERNGEDARTGLARHNLTGETNMKKHSYCESIHATSTSPWHIRELTDQGRKLGGGADTKALCGLEVSWDLEVDVKLSNADGICVTCLTKATQKEK